MRILLVRHPPVAARYHGICYGSTDVELDNDGLIQAEKLVRGLAERPATGVVHSGTIRTTAVAVPLAQRLKQEALVDIRLQERHFGNWEGLSWNEIYRRTGDAMNGMVTEPSSWRPPGGESTFEMRDRVMAWYSSLQGDGLVVAVCHGGPIAALRGTLGNLPVESWPGLIPPPGTIVALDKHP